MSEVLSELSDAGSSIAALYGELGAGAISYPFNVHSNALANAIFVKSGPCMLFGVLALSTKVSAQYLQLHDSATLPADGAVPVAVIDLQSGIARALQYLPLGRSFNTGCWVCNSTTAATKTLGAADTFFDVQYV